MSFVPPDLNVVIVSYNSKHVLGDLLDSLPAALDGLAAEVIVVDNASADGSAEFAEARRDCRVVRSANVGYAGGVNRGVREGVSGEAILILNPDVVLTAGSIPRLLAALQHDHIGIAVPKVQSPTGDLQPSLRRDPSLLRALGLTRTKIPALSEYVSDPADYVSARNVDWALGAIMLVSRKCYDALGGLDESYFLYSEETDLSLRARDIGLLTRYEPSSVAVHIGGQSGRSKLTNAMKAVNRVRLYRRRHGIVASWCYYCLTVATEITWLLRAGSAESGLLPLLLPSRRPAQLGCSDRVVPR
jgi:N-acetylglucosaminyl-diphospho-decaprenol L-rhamnosyltransferase